MGVVDNTKNVSAEEGMDSNNGLVYVSCSRESRPLGNGMANHPVSCVPPIVEHEISS